MKLDRRLLRLVGSYQAAFFLTLLGAIASALLIVGQARLLSGVVKAVFLDGAARTQVRSALLAWLGLIGLRVVFQWLETAAAAHLAVKVKAELQERLAAQILALGPIQILAAAHQSESAEKGAAGELANLAVGGIEALDAYFRQYIPGVLLAAILPWIYLAGVLPLDRLSALVLLLTAPLIPIFMILIGQQAAQRTRREWRALSRMSAFFLDIIQGLPTLKLFGQSRRMLDNIAQVSERYRQTTMGVLRVTFLSALALELVATISTAVVAVEIGLRLLYGRIGFEGALFVLFLAPEFYAPLRQLGARFHAGMAGVGAAERLFELLEQQPPGAPEAPDRVETAPVFAEIRGEDLAYSYPDGRQALRGVSFELRPGRKVALVGPSGGGKSTLSYLLLRFIAPQSGKVLVDGKPLTDLSLEAWRRAVAWVPQRPFMLHDTVQANIALADPQAGLEAIRTAAHLAGADEFIQALPQGYQTLVGERGARLSAGQVQRIALARAFLHPARLVILDEPSAFLDAESEERLQSGIQHLAQQRAVLVIAHRLQTVKDADEILVLEQGRVVERGAHASLLQGGRLYPQLINAHLQDVSAWEPTPSLNQTLPNAQAIARRAAPEGVPILGGGENGSMSVLARLLQLVAPLWRPVLLSVGLSSATIASSIGLLATSAYLISAAALQPSIAELQVAIVGVRAFGLGRAVFRYLERLVAHHTTLGMLARLRVWFYRALEPLAPAALESARGGDLLSRMVGDVGRLEDFFVRGLAPPLTAALVGIGMALFIGSLNPGYALVVLFFWLLAGVLLPFIWRHLGRAPGQKLVVETARLQAGWVDLLQGLADLSVYRRAGQAAAELNQARRIIGGVQLHLARLDGLQTALLSALASLGAWLLIVLAIPQVYAGELDGRLLAVLAFAMLAGFEALQPLPLAAQHLESHLAAAGRLFALAGSPEPVREPAGESAAVFAPLPGRSGLQVKELSFHYGTQAGAPDTLSRVSFDLPAGKRLAIVGPSGAGKTTLVQLLLRFRDYSSGEIWVDSSHLRKLSPEAWRARLAVASQNVYLFNARLRDNLLIANPQADQAMLEQAISRADLEGMIQALPEGYETWVGEQGVRLSAGQRQRLALARALLRPAEIMILDEPSANLDTLTESRVLNTILNGLGAQSLILITHRLVFMEQMDEILVLDEGRVVERGTHAGLYARRGLYRRMFDLQN